MTYESARSAANISSVLNLWGMLQYDHDRHTFKLGPPTPQIGDISNKSFHWLDNSVSLSFYIFIIDLFLDLFSIIQLPNPPITISSHWYLIEHPASLLQSTKCILIRAEVIIQTTEALQHFGLTLKLWQQKLYFLTELFTCLFMVSPGVIYDQGGTHMPKKQAKMPNEIGCRVNAGLEIEIRNLQTWFHLCIKKLSLIIYLWWREQTSWGGCQSICRQFVAFSYRHAFLL